MRLCGQFHGGADCSLARLISVRMSHWTGATSSCSGMMLYSVLKQLFPSAISDNASAFAFLEPGLYVTVNWKRIKNRAHLACCGFNCLAERRYSRFLWSVRIIKGYSAPSSQWRHFSIAAFLANSPRFPTS